MRAGSWGSWCSRGGRASRSVAHFGAGGLADGRGAGDHTIPKSNPSGRIPPPHHPPRLLNLLRRGGRSVYPEICRTALMNAVACSLQAPKTHPHCLSSPFTFPPIPPPDGIGSGRLRFRADLSNSRSNRCLFLTPELHIWSVRL